MSDARVFTSKLQGKRVLIIGGSSGIGFAVAEGCVELGAQVTISSSNQSRVETAVSRLVSTYPSASDRVQGQTCDLSNADVERNLEALFEKVGKVDHIIHTAGDNIAMMPLEDVSLEKIHAAGQLRAFSALLTAKVGSKYLTKSTNCSITFTTGSLSQRPLPGGWVVPALFSAGISSLTRQLALDLAPIRVNCVAPGAVDTEIWAGMPAEQKERVLKMVSEKMLTEQIGKAQDVAEAYLYLLKDGNATGSVINTNGGGLLV